MKPLEARPQTRLGVQRCLQLTLSGMSFRLFRSLITVSILALAVAFLVHMLSYGLIRHETQSDAAARLAEDRAIGRLLTRLAEPDGAVRIVESLAGAAGDGRLDEYRRWSGLGDAAFAAAVGRAEAAVGLVDWVASLPPTQRAVVIGDREATDLVARPMPADEVEALVARLDDLGLRWPGGDAVALRSLLTEGLAALGDGVAAIASGHRGAIEQVAAAVAPRSIRAAVAETPDAAVAAIAEAGFAVDPAAGPAMASLVRRSDQLDRLGKALSERVVRREVARWSGIAREDVSLESVLGVVDSLGEADELIRDAALVGDFADLEPPRVVELAEGFRTRQRLQAAVGDEVVEPRSGLLDLPTATLWLVALSFMVCVVGVANAMLMSVTERFSEIATMKCLGAMDRSVMVMFVFEAMIQGTVGGIAGLLLGLVLALMRGLAEFGLLVAAAASTLGEVFVAGAVSLAVGVVLAMVAAVGPAWVAARLAPMEAMRVE